MDPITVQEDSSKSRPPVTILGWLKTTLLDYPGKVASTVFLGGCNFRCPYCHNPGLVKAATGDRAAAKYDLQEILAYSATYSRMLEGICITGGEPLLQAGLKELCQRFRALGFKIKLDTNGSLPAGLPPLLEAGLLDYVAVDIKGPPDKIHAVANSNLSREDLVEAVQSSVDILQHSGVPYELRTTLVPGLLDGDDIRAIGKWLKGAPKFVLQQFRPGKTLDPEFNDLAPYPPAYFEEIISSLSGYFPECDVRGIG